MSHYLLNQLSRLARLVQTIKRPIHKHSQNLDRWDTWCGETPGSYAYLHRCLPLIAACTFEELGSMGSIATILVFELMLGKSRSYLSSHHVYFRAFLG
jgi:hypothetical protein